MTVGLSAEFYWLAVATVVVLSGARLTRLVTVDKFPPVVWLRHKYENATDGSGWQWLTLCGYCFSFWATLAVVMSGWACHWHEIWWLVNGTLGASYVAAIVMALDQDAPENDADTENDEDEA